MSITREQASKLNDQLYSHANYLIRLRERTSKFLAVDDPLM